MDTPNKKSLGAGVLSTFFLAVILFAQSCQSTASVQRPAAGNEYEITDRAENARRDSLLIEKYTEKLQVDAKKIESSLALYKFIDEQLNTPCSNSAGENTISDVQLAQQLYTKVYDRKIPASYGELYSSNLIAKFSATSYLAEGDLLFFEEKPEKKSRDKNRQRSRLNNEPLEKVAGVYLQNNRFVTCAEEDGAVAINNLKQEYWENRYKVAGRLR